MKKYVAETVGTFGLAIMVGLSLTGAFPVPTPLIAALTLGLFVYSMGHISGTHINPAVTIGAWSIGKINNEDAIKYILAQTLGAMLAAIFLIVANKLPVVSVVDSVEIGFAEMVGSFFFTFGIASVVYGKTPKDFSGLVVGGSLLMGVAGAVLLGSNGVLNPAVAYGIGSFGTMYVLGPIIGAVLGMNAYKHLH